MIVICLEGCHGSGKSALCDQFQNEGFTALDEAFMDLPSHSLHPQSLLMETAWVVNWFERILKFAEKAKCEGNTDKIFIADRSPFSAVFYSQSHGHLLEPLIRQHIKEIHAAVGVDIITVYVKVAPEILWDRIQRRLQQEPERAKFNEGDRTWMEKTLDFYERFEWDLEIRNEDPLCEVMQESLQIVSKHHAGFKECVNRRRSLSMDVPPSPPNDPIRPSIEVGSPLLVDTKLAELRIGEGGRRASTDSPPPRDSSSSPPPLCNDALVV